MTQKSETNEKADSGTVADTVSDSDINIVVNSEPQEQTAIEVAEVAVDIAVDSAKIANEVAEATEQVAEVAVETAEQLEDFEQWTKTQLQELTQTVNLLAEVQVIQAQLVDDLSNSQPKNSTEMLTPLSTEQVEIQQVTETEMTQAQVEVPEAVEESPQVETPLQNAVRQLKRRVRIL
jgi:hypothetical protein